MELGEALGKAIYKKIKENGFTIGEFSDAMNLNAYDTFAILYGSIDIPPYIMKRATSFLRTTKEELYDLSEEILREGKL